MTTELAILGVYFTRDTDPFILASGKLTPLTRVIANADLNSAEPTGNGLLLPFRATSSLDALGDGVPGTFVCADFFLGAT